MRHHAPRLDVRRPLALLLLACAFSAGAKVKQGQPAPAIEATTWEGGRFSLAAERGHVVIVHFWASWCTPCRLEMPILDAYYRRHHDDGVEVLGINMDDKDAMAEAHAAMQGFAFPAASYAQVHADGWGRIWKLPLTFVIDRNGVLRRDAFSASPKVDAAVLDAEVTPLLAQH